VVNKTEVVIQRRRLKSKITKISVLGDIEVKFNEKLLSSFPKDLN
jgi:hypothetical protein